MIFDVSCCLVSLDIIRLNEKKPVFELELLKDEHLIIAVWGQCLKYGYHS